MDTRLPEDFTVYPKGHEPEGHHPDDLKHIADLEFRLEIYQRKTDGYEVVIAALCAVIFGLTLYWIFL